MNLDIQYIHLKLQEMDYWDIMINIYLKIV